MAHAGADPCRRRQFAPAACCAPPWAAPSTAAGPGGCLAAGRGGRCWGRSRCPRLHSAHSRQASARERSEELSVGRQDGTWPGSNQGSSHTGMTSPRAPASSQASHLASKPPGLAHLYSRAPGAQAQTSPQPGWPPLNSSLLPPLRRRCWWRRSCWRPAGGWWVVKDWTGCPKTAAAAAAAGWCCCC
jgi:hypothetical protein